MLAQSFNKFLAGFATILLQIVNFLMKVSDFAGMEQVQAVLSSFVDAHAVTEEAGTTAPADD